MTAFLLENRSAISVSELDEIFDKWYDRKLRSILFPEYRNIIPIKSNQQECRKDGIATLKLENLIGLSDVKCLVAQAIDYYYVKTLYKSKGFPQDGITMNMVFSGNPGTAKTTVARILAGILKEKGVLPIGDLYEVGRADIVGKYVGWTAKNVKNIFAKAAGSVLFIDEAYSLVDDREGMFGDEAINTIVQEMENNRDKTVVIFAGYPNKMQEFLARNPGLESRIDFHIPFPDYSAKELLEISQVIAEEKGFRLSDSAKTQLARIFADTTKKETFGNGRFVRNVIESSVLHKASSLSKTDPEVVSADNVTTLTGEDIFFVPTEKKDQFAKIGFI